MRYFLIILTAVVVGVLSGCSDFTSSRTSSRNSLSIAESPGAVATLQARATALATENARITCEQPIREQPTQYLVVPSAADARALAEARACNEALNRQIAERERIIVELKRCPAPVQAVKYELKKESEPKVCQPVVPPPPEKPYTQFKTTQTGVSLYLDIAKEPMARPGPACENKWTIRDLIDERKRGILSHRNSVYGYDNSPTKHDNHRQ